MDKLTDITLDQDLWDAEGPPLCQYIWQLGLSKTSHNQYTVHFLKHAKWILGAGEHTNYLSFNSWHRFKLRDSIHGSNILTLNDFVITMSNHFTTQVVIVTAFIAHVALLEHASSTNMMLTLILWVATIHFGAPTNLGSSGSLLQSDFIYLRRYIGLHRFLFLTSHSSKPMYDTISKLSCVRCDLVLFLCTISILEPPLLRYLVLGEYRSLST